MDLELGTLVGGYRLERLLGRGGMGEVYLATDTSLDRPVALKFLPSEFARDPTFRTRFLAESRVAASMDHPHIVPIYEAGERERRLFIAMRYVDGTDLGTLIQREGPLEIDRTLALLGGVADALDAAHDRGLVHRDVKPGNILVTATARMREHAYLADFGLVKHLGSAGDFTQAGQILGSLGYIAPEQIEGRPIDARADVYSFACVLYEALAGRPPFVNDRDVATLWAHLQAPRPRVSDVVPALASIDEVVQRGMAIEPGDRFPSAGELIRAFGGTVHGSLPGAGTGALGVVQPGPPYSAPGTASPRLPRRRAAAAGLLAVGLAGVALLGMALANGMIGVGPRDQASPTALPSFVERPTTQSPTSSGSLVPADPEVAVLTLAENSEGFQEMSAELEPGGRYEMALARPRTRFTVPGPGWYADRDFLDGFNLVHEAPNVGSSGSAFPDYFSVGVVQVAFEGPCDHSPRRVIEQTPAAMLEFLAAHPTVDATDPVPVAFGAHSGLATELTVEAPPPEGTCSIPADLPESVAERHKQRTYLFLFSEDVFHISPDEHIKVVAVDVDGRLVVVMYGTVYKDRWGEVAPEAEKLLQSIEFDR